MVLSTTMAGHPAEEIDRVAQISFEAGERMIRSLAVSMMLLAPVAMADAPVKPVLIGIFARDYAETVGWYTRNLGFEVAREVVNDEANFRIGFLDNGAFELEVYADIEAAPGQPRLKRDRFGMPTEGFVKLSVETDDLPALANTLRANGVEFVREINTSDRKPGQSWFMVGDPDGHLVQVFGPTQQAVGR